MPNANLMKLKSWDIKRSGPGLCISGIDVLTGRREKITALFRVGLSADGVVVGIDKAGTPRVQLEILN